MTHKKRKRQTRLNALLPDKPEQNGSESKVRRKKKANVDRSNDASSSSVPSE